MKTYDKEYIKDCILNKKVIPPIIRKEIYIEVLKLIETHKENFICIAMHDYLSDTYNIHIKELYRLYVGNNYKPILKEFNRDNIKKYKNRFNDTYDYLDQAWFDLSMQGYEDRITFIKLMIDLVNKEIKQENN
jgi:hypothetical protein